MEQDIKDIIKNRYSSLPKEIQDALISDSLYQNIVKVAQKHQLLIDKMAQFEDEVLMLMLGVSEPEQFPKTLSENLSIPLEKAEALAVDAAEEIFTPIRNAMKNSSVREVPEKSKFPNRADIQAPKGTTTPFNASSASAVSPIKVANQVPIQVNSAPRPQTPVPQPVQMKPPMQTPAPISSPTVRTTPVPAPAPVQNQPTFPRPSLAGAFETRSVQKKEVLDVGIAPAKKDYRSVDPYREPIE